MSMQELTTFENYIISNINSHIGEWDNELCEFYNCEYDKNKSQWVELAYRMLGISSNKEEKLKKANIAVKTIRINKNGKIKESMSFPTIRFSELVHEVWEESYIYRYFSNTKFLFVVFHEGENGYCFVGSHIWKMPDTDLDNVVKEEWLEVQQVLRAGVNLSVQKNAVKNNFPKKSETRIIHIRPKASKAAYKLKCGYSCGVIDKDADVLPNGEWMTKQCFWLNNDYILEQLSILSQNIRYEVQDINLDDKQIDVLKQYLQDDFYFVDEIEKYFSEILHVDDYKYINTHNMKKLGYRSYFNFFVSTKFKNAQEYFAKKLLEEDLVNTNLWDSRLSDIQIYIKEIERLKLQYRIFEYSKKSFINKDRLENGGITDKHLESFTDSVIEFAKEEYFTICSLKKEGFRHELFDLGFENCFYEDVLYGSKRVNNIKYQDIMIFSLSHQDITIEDFIEQLVREFKKINIYDLLQVLEEKYGLVIELPRMKKILKRTSLHYDDLMEKVYINYDMYFEEI